MISLRSWKNGYVAAEANGKIRANREQIGAWEVFQVAPGVRLRKRPRSGPLSLPPTRIICVLLTFICKPIIIIWCIKFNHQKYGFRLETHLLILQSTVFRHYCFTWWPSWLLRDVRWRFMETITICKKSKHFGGAIFQGHRNHTLDKQWYWESKGAI